ncbi:MAG: 2-phosphosulfolactate phosphatase [Gaiellaceae bacterium]
MPQLEVVPARESTPYDAVLADNPVVVVSDVIRATTTATTAIARGNRCIPVLTVEAAWAAAANENGSTLLAGEQGGDPIPNFDLNNSPAAVDRVEGKTIILLSTSGTRVIHGAQIASDVYVGCLRNAAATAKALAAPGRDVVFLAACTRGEFRDEDQLFAGWIARDLSRAGYQLRGEVTHEMVERWGDAPPDAMLGSASVAFLRKAGHEDDLDFVLTRIDDLDFAVRVADGEFVRS